MRTFSLCFVVLLLCQSKEEKVKENNNSKIQIHSHFHSDLF